MHISQKILWALPMCSRGWLMECGDILLDPPLMSAVAPPLPQLITERRARRELESMESRDRFTESILTEPVCCRLDAQPRAGLYLLKAVPLVLSCTWIHGSPFPQMIWGRGGYF